MSNIKKNYETGDGSGYGYGYGIVDGSGSGDGDGSGWGSGSGYGYGELEWDPREFWEEETARYRKPMEDALEEVLK